MVIYYTDVGLIVKEDTIAMVFDLFMKVYLFIIRLKSFSLFQ